jgi:acyl-CoA thioesterase-1
MTRRAFFGGRGVLGAAVALGIGLCLMAGADSVAPRRTIVFFGDSLTAGYGLPDPGTQSFPARVQEHIDAEHLPWEVENAGLSGETSAGGLRRIDWVLNRRPDAFFLELGANDGLRGTAPEVTLANLQAIIDRVQTRYPGTPVIIAGMRMPPNMGADYDEAFRATYPALATRNHATLVPFLLEGVARDSALNQADGIHPNPTGAALVAETVWKVIRPVLLQGSK